MESERFNEKLRGILEKLHSDGFSKTDIANISLGSTRVDQLNNFLRGANIGLKPLNKIFNLLGYDIHLVPIARRDIETVEKLNDFTFTKFDEVEFIMFDYLQHKLAAALESNKTFTTYMLEYAIDKYNKEHNITKN